MLDKEKARLEPVIAGVQFYWTNDPRDGLFGMYCPPCQKVVRGGGGRTVINLKSHFETPGHATAYCEWKKVRCA
jgi:hypothetical protein